MRYIAIVVRSRFCCVVLSHCHALANFISAHILIHYAIHDFFHAVFVLVHSHEIFSGMCDFSEVEVFYVVKLIII